MPREQLEPVGDLAGEIAGIVGRGQSFVAGRIPDGRVDAVQDPAVAIPPRPQGVVNAPAVCGRERFQGVGGADRVDHVRGTDAFAQQIDAVGNTDRCGQAQSPRPLARDPAVEGQVVAGQDGRGLPQQCRAPPHVRHGQQRRRSLPVMAVQHIEWYAVGCRGGQRHLAQQAEAGAVVGVVGAVLAVEARAVEAGRMVDQAQAVAVRRPVPEGHLDRGCRRSGTRRGRQGDRDRPLRRPDEGLEPAVARQEHVDLVAQLAERPGQRVDHIRQTTGLGEGFAFRRDHGDAHRAMVAPATVARPYRSPLV